MALALLLNAGAAAGELRSKGTLSYEVLWERATPKLRNAIECGLVQLNGGAPLPEFPQFEPLEGGFSSALLFTFELHGVKYVLRVLDPKRMEEPHATFDKRSNEVNSQRAASALAIAPKFFYSDPDALVLIMEYVVGEPLSLQDLDNSAIICRLGQAIRAFQQCDVALPFHRNQFARAEKHYRSAMQKGIAFPTGFHPLYAQFLQEEAAHPIEQVPCHGDLNPMNILIAEERPFFIDWAGASLGDPYSDLGYLAFLSGMKEPQRERLLEAYLGREPCEAESAALRAAMAHACLLTAVVWFDFSESEEERLKPYDERIARLDALLSSPALKRGGEYIRRRESVDPTRAPAEQVQLFALGFFKEYLELIGQ